MLVHLPFAGVLLINIGRWTTLPVFINRYPVDRYEQVQCAAHRGKEYGKAEVWKAKGVYFGGVIKGGHLRKRGKWYRRFSFFRKP